MEKGCIGIDRLSIIWTSDLFDKIRRELLQAVTVSVLLYGCITWTPEERARWEVHKSAIWCFEQTLGTAPYKTAVIWSLASHLTNYPSKTSKEWWALLEKKGRNHKQRSFLGTWISLYLLTNKDLHTSVLCGHWMQSGWPAESDDR